MLNYDVFLYWINERERVRIKKEAGLPKPWSENAIFRQTYFCNVRREDDRVTKFIRTMYSPMVKHPYFLRNITISRFLNWPPTLERLGYMKDEREWGNAKEVLNAIRTGGDKVWGSAYVVTTHGMKMDKIDYLCDCVMPSIVRCEKVNYDSCATAAMDLQYIEGVSTFMAGQIIADLKNTRGHPLMAASDWQTFVLHGPGSRRGMDWLIGHDVTLDEWYSFIPVLQKKLEEDGWRLHAQDIQNCLCEFDKYCRIEQGTGRSKRGYPGG